MPLKRAKQKEQEKQRISKSIRYVEKIIDHGYTFREQNSKENRNQRRNEASNNKSRNIDIYIYKDIW